jgi:cellobiose phosphorylase
MYMHKFGHFNEIGNEYIITNPETPRAFDNFLWNDTIFSNVQQTGIGYCDYQIGTDEAVQLFTGIGRICDFDVFGREHLMNRLIYIRDNNTGEFWNINWEPVCMKYEKYECIHGLGYTIIKTVVKGIYCEFRVFIPKGKDPVELWSLKIADVEGRKRYISIFVYNQFQFKFKWGFDSYGDMVYRSTWLNEEHNAVVATKKPFRKPHNHLTAFMTADEHIVAFDGSRDAFVGLYRTLKEPVAVEKGRCSNIPGSSDSTVGAMQFDIELVGGQEKLIGIIIGIVDNEDGIAPFRTKYMGNFDKYYYELKEENNVLIARNSIKTPDLHFDRLYNNWIKQAALFGAAWCRWGWNGYRDIVQHGFGVSVLEPERTKKILLDALKYQYGNGLAIRGWNPVDEKPYSDSALWLVFTLVSYLKETLDMELLSENVLFYDGGSASVQEHIDRALDFLENNKGAHNLILIKYGDWNDSLTTVGKEGRGESVWLSEAYAEAMLQMSELAEYTGNIEKKDEYLERRENIMKALNDNAWDGKWYTRCFDDYGKPVGSNCNQEGKIFMESQSWALISGLADEERTKAVINSCDEMLLTDFGYLLLAPTFTKIDESIGRISSMQPGVAENGTVYSHLNIWMIKGLLKYKMADKAYDIFKRISPGYMKDEKDPKHKCPPYMYSNCYFGPDHKNNRFQAEFTWITGSVAWFNNVILKDMLGAKAEFKGLLIDPCIPSEWEECEVDRYFRGAIYKIRIKNYGHIQSGELEILVDGKRIESNLVQDFADGKTHIIDVIIKEYSL